MDPNFPDLDVQQNLHLLFPSTHPGGKAPDTTDSRGHSRSDCQQHHPHLAMDFPMQSDCQCMEQADPRLMLYRRPIAENHHLSGPHLHHIRLHACPLPHCPFMESPDSAAHQSRFVCIDGSRPYVRPMPLPLSKLLTNLAHSNSTAACCIVRTVLNWQNVNSDPTWESIDNWYWRSWEVCIGIVAACIPALRPGYKTVSAGIRSYLSHRSSRKSSDFALVESPDPSRTPANRKANAQHIARPRAAYDPALGAAAHAVSAEADRAREYGAGEDGFAMNYLPGDMKTADQGIKKTTRIDVAGRSADASQRSLDLGDVERGGFGNRDFL